MAFVASLVATLVGGTFAVALWRRWQRGRSRALLYWSISLAMFALASAMLAVGALGGWSETSFRLFYLFGAVLNVPWLALGSSEVNARSPVVSRVTGAFVLLTGALFLPGLDGPDAALYLIGALLGLTWGVLLLVGHPDVIRAGVPLLVTAFTVAGAVAVLGTDLLATIGGDELPEGRDLFPLGPRGFAVGGNAVGAVLVIVSAVAASANLAWGRPGRGTLRRARSAAEHGLTDVLARWFFAGRRGQGVRHLVRGNLLIALGVLVAAAGGALSFLGETTGHAVGLGIGVTIMYAGFVRTIRPVEAPGTEGHAPDVLGTAVAADGAGVVIDVYTRDNCGLCRRAERLIAEEAPRAEVRRHDIDQDEELLRRYHVRVPVVSIGGVEVAEGYLETGTITRAVAATGRRERIEP